MAWILGAAGSYSEDVDIPTIYTITSYDSSSSSAAITVKKTNENVTSFNLPYQTAQSRYCDFGDIIIDYGQTTSQKWTIKVKQGRTVIYNNTEYSNGAIISQWFYYTYLSNAIIIESTQPRLYHHNGYTYNVITKSTSSSSAIITLKEYYNDSLIQSVDVAHNTVTSTPYNMNNIDLFYNQSSYCWQLKPHNSASIIELYGEYLNGDIPIWREWTFTQSINYTIYDCTS